MIDCGIKALKKNYYEDCVCLLAGADCESEHTVLQLFKATTEVIGIKLPEPDDKKLWLALKRKEFGATMDFQSEYEDNIIIINGYFSKSKNQEVLRFQRVLKVLIDEDIKSYEAWLDDLINSAKKVSRESKFFETIQLTVELITDYSYGALLKRHYEETEKIIKLLKQNQKVHLI